MFEPFAGIFPAEIPTEIPTEAAAEEIIGFQLKLYHFVSNLASGCSSPGERMLAFAICSLLSFGLAFLCDLIIRNGLRKLAEKTKNPYDDQLIRAMRLPLIVALTATGIYFSTAWLNLEDSGSSCVHRIYLAVIILIVLLLLLKSIRIVSDILREIAVRTGNTYNNLLISLLTPVCKLVVWVVGLLFLFDNVFHFNIASLLAGAGIAAMAVAFAAQNTIANIFGAISLIADRPFQLGQRIQVDGKDGIVEAIGLRSTRLRSLDGTLWCIPNKVMSESTILNFSVRPNFKYVFTVTLTYSHTVEQLKQGQEILHKILDQHPLFDAEKQPPRITFETMGAYSLDLQAVCWFQTTDFMEFTRAKEEINFQILKEFNAAGLVMAFPTQSIYVEKLPQNK